jgi:hypothetical protein
MLRIVGCARCARGSYVRAEPGKGPCGAVDGTGGGKGPGVEPSRVSSVRRVLPVDSMVSRAGGVSLWRDWPAQFLGHGALPEERRLTRMTFRFGHPANNAVAHASACLLRRDPHLA